MNYGGGGSNGGGDDNDNDSRNGTFEARFKSK